MLCINQKQRFKRERSNLEFMDGAFKYKLQIPSCKVSPEHVTTMLKDTEFTVARLQK